MGASWTFATFSFEAAFAAALVAGFVTTDFGSETFFLAAGVAICFAGWVFAVFTAGFSDALTGADLALAVSSAGFAGLADEMGVLFRAVHKPLSSTQKGT